MSSPLRPPRGPPEDEEDGPEARSTASPPPPPRGRSRGKTPRRLLNAPTWSRTYGWEQFPHGSGVSEPRDMRRQPRLLSVRGHRTALTRAQGRARSQDSAKFFGNAGMGPERAAGAGATWC